VASGQVRSGNRLAGSASLYLRQHAEDPVDWWPWCKDARAEAARRDVPIFLSIGYAACHWCHVMAHECFSSPEIARQINESFVPIKVDRAEHPEVDAVYMEAVVAFSGQGGWPMTVVTTPDGRPFFAGTYFPPDDRGGRPGLPRVLAAIVDAWRDRRQELEDQAVALARAVRERLEAPPDAWRSASGRGDDAGALVDGDEVRPEVVGALAGRAIAALSARFDPVHGGFGRAPKFPSPPVLELLAHLAAAPVVAVEAAGEASEMMAVTLRRMAAGGLRDHLGGGFARYSTDAAWVVPHFEKMLTDQAGLLGAYLRGWQVRGEPGFLALVEETVAYLGDLEDPTGLYHAAEDADAGGEEGAYYLFDRADLEAVLSPAVAVEVARAFGIGTAPGLAGRVLHRPGDASYLWPDELAAAREELRRLRSARERPARDRALLADANAMVVAALADAAAAAGRADWARRAEEAGQALFGLFLRPDGRHGHVHHAGRTMRRATAADLAWMLVAAVRLHRLTGRAWWVERADEVAGELVSHYFDRSSGLFALAADDAEVPLARPRDALDGAASSASGVAALGLAELSALLGDDERRAVAVRVVGTLAPLAARAPEAAATVLRAALVLASGPVEVVVGPGRPDLVRALLGAYLPGAVVAWGESFPSPLFGGREEPAAWVCRRGLCEAPVRNLANLAATLVRAGVRRGPFDLPTPADESLGGPGRSGPAPWPSPSDADRRPAPTGEEGAR